MQLLELTIDDTSPLIVYSPFRDTLSTPDLSNGWNPYYNTSGFASPIGRVGIGESYHITSMDGAFLSVKWNGNGIRLLGNTTSCSFALTLDGADFKPNATSLSNTLVDIPDLQYGVHTLTLTTQISQNQAPRNSSLFAFDGAIIRTIARGVSSDFTFRQQPLDSHNVSYNGRWAFGPSPTGQQFYISNTAGDRASTTFNGTAFILQGMTTPEPGNYSVTLDGVTTSLSAQSSFTVPNTTLFFATGLNDSFIHSVEVTNNGGKLSLLDGGFWAVAAFSGLPPPPPDALANSKSPDAPLSGGTVAAFALAGVLFAIIATIVLFLIWRKRRRRRNDNKPTTWDDKKYVVPNSRPGYRSSFRNSWRFNRQNRASSDFASYRAKGDTITLESAHLEGTRSSRSGRLNEPSTWQREEDSEAVEGPNVQDISLPILFKHSDESEFAPESRHPYSVYDPTSNLDRSTEMKNLKNSSTSSTPVDIDRTSVALANLKNKGKARQITGADSTMEDSFFETSSRLSFSPNDLLRGLHLRISGGKKSFSRIKSPQGSVSLSLNPSTSPVPDQFRDSGLSSFHAASNPSARGRESQQQSPSSTSPTETLPSFPRSVSDSNSNTIIPHRRQNSRGYLLDDQTELGEDLGSGERSSQPPFHAYRNQGNSNSRSILPSSLSLRQVVRSLSPRISEMRIEGDHYNNNNPHTDHCFYPETLAEQQSILEEDHLLTVMAPSTPSGRDSMSTVQFARNVSPSVARGLPFSPSPVSSETHSDNQVESDTVGLSTHAELDRTRLSPTLPSLKRTSPFNIWFDWQSERQSKRASESSRLRVPGQFDTREDFVQGTSRNRFRLTPLTMTHSPSINSSPPSRESTSFLDFTNSSEDSSTRTNSFSTQFGSRIFGDSASSIRRGGRMAELKSRWSDTTSSTMRRDSSREQQSSSADKSSRRRTYHTSTIPPSIYVTSSSPSSEIQLPTKKKPAQRESDSTQFSTENPVHVHPSSILDHELESRRESLRSQRAPLDTLVVRTASGSDESSSGTSSRWISSESSSQFHTRLLATSRYPPLREGTDEASTSSVYLPNPTS